MLPPNEIEEIFAAAQACPQTAIFSPNDVFALEKFRKLATPLKIAQIIVLLKNISVDYTRLLGLPQWKQETPREPGVYLCWSDYPERVQEQPFLAAWDGEQFQRATGEFDFEVTHHLETDIPLPQPAQPDQPAEH